MMQQLEYHKRINNTVIISQKSSRHCFTESIQWSGVYFTILFNQYILNPAFYLSSFYLSSILNSLCSMWLKRSLPKKISLSTTNDGTPNIPASTACWVASISSFLMDSSSLSLFTMLSASVDGIPISIQTCWRLAGSVMSSLCSQIR
eukprot:m.43766 g.43766  ORF g.43766 m.43766 type:complete len:147 (-) comp7128_c0_seq3:532-972(-)